jgi:protein ATS1
VCQDISTLTAFSRLRAKLLQITRREFLLQHNDRCLKMLYSFGSNSNGQLSLGHDEDTHIPMRCLAPAELPAAPPKQIVAGGNHTLVLFSCGRLFATGSNTHGQCGISRSVGTSFSAFQEVPSPPNETEGRWMLVSAGWDFSILVSESGEIYSCGFGSKGELGAGLSIKSTQLKKIDEFVEPRIAFLSSGMAHTLAVLESGEVYGWGAARKGQLGDPVEKVVYTPRRVKLDFAAAAAACGREFSFVISENGDRHAVLGENGRYSISSESPRQGDLRGWKKVGACWGSIVVLLQDGSLKAWGRNDKGQVPPRIDGIKDIAIGSEHGLALTARKGRTRAIAWGWGEHGNCGKHRSDGGGDVVGEVFEVDIPEVVTLQAVGAGCATSWLWGK